MDTKLYQAIFESAEISLILSDQSGKIVLANNSACHLFGYQIEELINAHVEILLPHRFRAQHTLDREKYNIDLTVRRMGKSIVPLFGLNKAGIELELQISLIPIFTPKGLYVLNEIYPKMELATIFANTNFNVSAKDLIQGLRILSNISEEKAALKQKLAEKTISVEEYNEKLRKLSLDEANIDKLLEIKTQKEKDDDLN